jgi:hypothetical protein
LWSCGNVVENVTYNDKGKFACRVELGSCFGDGGRFILFSDGMVSCSTGVILIGSIDDFLWTFGLARFSSLEHP